MIPNLLSTLLGIALVYCAILAPGWINGNLWAMLGSGVLVAIFAWWARAGDKLKSFDVANATLGVALILLGLASSAVKIPQLVVFWWVFWVGIIVAVLAFWSALFTRDSSSEPLR